MKTKIQITGLIFNSLACAGTLIFMATGAHAQNLFVSSLPSLNTTNGSIYEITPNGTVSTFATGITYPGYMAFNGAGDLFVESSGSIIEITPNGVKSTFATGPSLFQPSGLACNSAGDLFVSDNSSIIEITPGGVESTFENGVRAYAMAFNSAGDLFAGTGQNITEIEPGGLQLSFGPGAYSLAFNNSSDLFAMYYEYQDIVKITPNGTVSTFATTPVTEFDSQQLTINNQGNLFVANPTLGEVVEFNSSGAESNFASGLGDIAGMAFQPIPEPSVMALFGIGAAGLILRRRR